MKLHAGRLLVPVDLGPNTQQVADAAAQLATVFDAEVSLQFVIEEVPRFPEALDLLEQAARERLEALQKVLQSKGVSAVQYTCVVGKPYEKITQAANDVETRLIVLGAGGSADCARLGTTTSRVLHYSAKPVLAVRNSSAKGIQRILCPVDCSGASARGLRNAIVLARKLGARLTVLFVVAELGRSPVSQKASSDMMRVFAEYEKAERAQFEVFLQGVDFEGLEWDEAVHYGRPGEEIANLAHSGGYDLVVIGSTGRSGLSRILLGSTAERVSHRASCSVLTVKHEDIVTTSKLEAGLADLRHILSKGQGLLDKGQLDEATECFERCLQSNPYYVPALLALASAHDQLGDTERASELREQAIAVRRELWDEPAEQAEEWASK